MFPEKVLHHPEKSVLRSSVNVQGRYFQYVRHTEGVPLGGFMPRILLRVRFGPQFLCVWDWSCMVPLKPYHLWGSQIFCRNVNFVVSLALLAFHLSVTVLRPYIWCAL